MRRGILAQLAAALAARACAHSIATPFLLLSTGCQLLGRVQPAALALAQPQAVADSAAEQADEQQASQPPQPPQPPALPPELERWRGHNGAPPLPWGAPLLPAAALRRGLGFYGSGGRLERVVAALMRGEPATVVTIGGSVARGAGSSREDRAFPARFAAFLNATWPHP